MSNFSKTALKQLRRLTKNQLFDMVVKISNYAEEQKAASMILMARVSELEKQINGKQPPQELQQPASDERQALVSEVGTDGSVATTEQGAQNG